MKKLATAALVVLAFSAPAIGAAQRVTDEEVLPHSIIGAWFIEAQNELVNAEA